MNKCAKFHKDSPSGKKDKFNLPSVIELSETAVQLCVETLCKRATSVAHLTNFSFEFFYEMFTEDASLLLLYHGAKKSKMTKNSNQGGPALILQFIVRVLSLWASGANGMRDYPTLVLREQTRHAMRDLASFFCHRNAQRILLLHEQCCPTLHQSFGPYSMLLAKTWNKTSPVAVSTSMSPLQHGQCLLNVRYSKTPPPPPPPPWFELLVVLGFFAPCGKNRRDAPFVKPV